MKKPWEYNIELGNRKDLGFICESLIVTAFFTLFILYVHPDFSALTLSKYEALMALSVICLLLTVWMLFISKLRGYKPKSFKDTLKDSSITVKISVLMFIIVLLSALLSSYLGEGNPFSSQMPVIVGTLRYEGLLSVSCYFLLFWCVSAYGGYGGYLPKSISVLIALFFAVFFIQNLNINIFGLYPYNTTIKDFPTLVGTIGNIDMVSGFMCLVLPILVFSFITLSKPYIMFFLPALLLGSFVWAHIKVDSGIVALGTVFVLTVPYLVRNRKRLLKSSVALFIVFLGCALGRGTRFGWKTGSLKDFYLIFNTPFKIYITLSVVFLAVFLLVFFKGRKINYILLSRITAVSLALLFVTGILVLLLGDFKDRYGVLYQAQQILKGNFDNSLGGGRIGFWKDSVKTASENLIIGTGPDTFALSYADYRILQGMSPYIVENGVNKVLDTAHNNYLQILVHYGLTGLITYLAFLGTVIIRALKNIKRNPNIIILLTAVTAYVIQDFFSFSTVIVTPLFFIVLGVLEAEIKKVKVFKPSPFNILKDYSQSQSSQSQQSHSSHSSRSNFSPQ